jgi:RNA recognition motif-containing protein
VTDIQQTAVETATRAVTGEDAFQKERRLAASKTVIIENIALDLGLTAREIQKFLLEQYNTVYKDSGLDIIDIDMSNGPTSIAVELAEKSMVDRIK